MNYELYKRIYNKILDGTSTKEERIELYEAFVNLGGMSNEWFLSKITNGEEPSSEELETFLTEMSNILNNDY